MQLKRFSGFVAVVCIAAVGLILWHNHTTRNVQQNPPNRITSPASKGGFNKQQYSLTAANSLWVVVNKRRPLQPKTYVPRLVVPTIPMRSNITNDEKYVGSRTAPSLEKMVASAKQQGISLNLQSGYRSYKFQANLYNHYVRAQGRAVADEQSARPGHSEHQTGLAADLGGVTTPSCNVTQCFATTPEGKWLAANAYRYGFIIRYPKGQQVITGYEYEPWHVRYVGTLLSEQMHRTGSTTLEGFFGLPAAPTYN